MHHEVTVTFPEIVELLNELSVIHEIGNLQSWRGENLGRERAIGRKIFWSSTTHEKYAFHYGGRKEIQFNIGCDLLDWFRYGVAFSFESGPYFDEENYKKLFAKVQRYNEYFIEHRKKFASYSGFTQKKGKIVALYAADLIPEVEYKNHKRSTFFFIGKYFNKKVNEITTDDCHTILETFDELFDLYKFVESTKI